MRASGPRPPAPRARESPRISPGSASARVSGWRKGGVSHLEARAQGRVEREADVGRDRQRQCHDAELAAGAKKTRHKACMHECMDAS